jgi:hypothetical protein
MMQNFEGALKNWYNNDETANITLDDFLEKISIEMNNNNMPWDDDK